MGDQDIQRCKWVQNAITHFYGIRICARIVKIQKNFNKSNTIDHNFLQLEHNNSDMFRYFVGHPQGVYTNICIQQNLYT